MNQKLYVGNLDYGATDSSLQTLFAQAGTVISAQVLIDKMSGRSRGFGFVEMSKEDAEKAIEMFNGKDFDGRKLVVNEARPMGDRPAGGGNDRRGGGGGFRGRGGFGGGGGYDRN